MEHDEDGDAKVLGRSGCEHGVDPVDANPQAKTARAEMDQRWRIEALKAAAGVVEDGVRAGDVGHASSRAWRQCEEDDEAVAVTRVRRLGEAQGRRTGEDGQRRAWRRRLGAVVLGGSLAAARGGARAHQGGTLYGLGRRARHGHPGSGGCERCGALLGLGCARVQAH